MLIRRGRSIVFECDDCGDSLDTDTDDFKEAKQFLQDNDWRSRMIGNLWCHYCFGCYESLK